MTLVYVLVQETDLPWILCHYIFAY